MYSSYPELIICSFFLRCDGVVKHKCPLVSELGPPHISISLQSSSSPRYLRPTGVLIHMTSCPKYTDQSTNLHFISQHFMEFVEDKRIVFMPGIPLYHGVEFSYPARSLINKLDKIVIIPAIGSKLHPVRVFLSISSHSLFFPLFCFPVICFGALPNEPFTKNGFAATTPYEVSLRNGFPSPNALKFKTRGLWAMFNFLINQGFTC